MPSSPQTLFDFEVNGLKRLRQTSKATRKGSEMTQLRKRFYLITAVLLWSTVPSQAQNPQGSEFQVNSFSTSGQEDPAVATGSSFVVVWESDGPGAGGSDSSSRSPGSAFRRAGPGGTAAILASVKSLSA